MTIRLHRGDLPDLARYQSGAVAIDTETMGLDPRRDRLCVVQLSPGDGSADVVQLPAGRPSAPNLTKLLGDTRILKIFHFGRFDLGVLYQALGVMAGPVYCTKIASRLARTYTDKHGLKDLVKELLGVDLSKQQQLSDWGLEDRFVFAGFQPSAAGTVTELDAVVVPSRREACPLVAMEAMVLGCPLIASDCIGLRELTAGSPALSSRAGDASSLAGSIEQFLRHRDTLKERARAYVPTARQAFESAHTAQGLVSVFERALNASARRQ